MSNDESRPEDLSGDGHDPLPTDETLTQLLTRAHRPPEMDPAARKRVLEHVLAAGRATATPSHEVKKVVLSLVRWRRPTVAGAIAALVAAAALALFWLRPAPLIHENVTAIAQKVTLSDGTVLVLDADSMVRDFGKRHIELVRGRLLVDVAAHRDAFVVDTEHGTAKALGTRFLVGVDGAAMHAAVARGRVELSGHGGREIIGAGQEGHVGPERAGVVREPAPRLSHLASWARPALEEDTIAPQDPIRRGNLIAREPRWGQEWPLPIRNLVVDVHVEGSVARTTIDQTFFNHTQRQLEGQYSFPLPPGAAISRLAMFVDGHRMESAVVERERGRNIYEEIVHRRRDPALLEWMSGNVFRMRIFPLPARREKRVVLSYTQTLESLYGTQRLVVPIPEIDMPVGKVTYRVRVVDGAQDDVLSTSHRMDGTVDGSDRVLSFEAEGYALGDDISIAIRPEDAPSIHVETLSDAGGDYVMVRTRPELPTASAHPTRRSWVVLFDTSASRSSTDLAMQRQFLTALMDQWDEGDHYAIVAVDAAPRVLTDGFQAVTASSPREALAELREKTAEGLGQTDLSKGIATARALLSKAPEGERHVLYLGDGVATADDQHPKRLAEALGEDATFVGVGMGDVVDLPLLRTLADRTGGYVITVPRGDDLAWRAFDLIATLNTPRLLGVQAELQGAGGEPIGKATAYGPAQIASGEDALFVARLPAGETAARLRLRGTVQGEAWSTSIEIDRPEKRHASYLPRLWAERRVAALIIGEPSGHQAEITALGMQHFLVTPFTSLLVVETEKMAKDLGLKVGTGDGWAKYGLPDRIENRYERPTSAARLADAADGTIVVRKPLRLLQQTNGGLDNQELRNFGMLGLIGSGIGGGGRGKGFGFGHGRLGGPSRLQDVSTIVVGSSAGLDFRSTGRRDVLKQNRVRMGAKRPALAEAKRGFLNEVSSFDRQLAVDGKSVADNLVTLSASAADIPTRASGLWTGDSISPISGERRPVALQYSRDQTLDDLSAFVPALTTDSTDFLREAGWLHAVSRGEERGGQTADRQWISKWTSLASKAQGAEAWRADDGTTMARNRKGIIAIERTTPFSLEERTVVGERSVHTFYPELQLVVRRPLGPSRAAVVTELTPFWLPSFEELDRCFDVSAKGEQDVTLRLPLPGPDSAGDDARSIELTVGLDDSGAVTSMERTGYGYRRMHFDRTGDALVLSDEHGGRSELSRARSDALDFSVATPDGWTAVDMPLVEPGTWERAAEKAESGSKEHRHALRQLLAVHAAVGNRSALHDALMKIGQTFGTPERGEFALAGAAVTGGDMSGWMDSQPEGDPVALHMRAVKKHASGTDATAAFEHAKDLPGLVGNLARYRIVLSQIERGEPSPLDAFRAFANRSQSPEMTFSLVSQLQSRRSYEHPVEVRKAWLTAAEMPALTTTAMLAEARIARQQGDHVEAKKLALAALTQALERGEHPSLSQNDRYLYSGGGRDSAGLDSLWTLYRQRMLESADPSAWTALLSSARALGRADDLAPIAAVLRGREIRNPDVALQLAYELLLANRPEEALRRLEPLMDGPGSAAALSMAAQAAEVLGRYGSSASFLSRAMNAESEGVGLTEMRGRYGRLFDLHVRAASAESGPPNAALAVAAEWRRLDPDHADIDIRCANLLFGLGQKSESWRHLSSIVERHPAEGSAHAEVADVLERRGDLKRALTYWRRATEVEPTNPTWLLRMSHALRAGGDSGGSSAALEKIAESDWQPRFANIVRQAKALHEMP